MIQKIYNEIKKNKKIPTIDEKVIFSISEEQKASLFCLSMLYEKTDNSQLKSFLINNNPWLIKYERMLLDKESVSPQRSMDISFLIIKKHSTKKNFLIMK